MASIISTPWLSENGRTFIAVDTDAHHVLAHTLDQTIDTLTSRFLRLFPINVTSLDYLRLSPGWVAANDSSPTLFSVFDDAAPVALRTQDLRVSSVVAFSPTDQLAVGLEKTKAHHGVHVYASPFELKKYSRFLANEGVVLARWVDHSTLLAGTSVGIREIDIRARRTAVSHDTLYTEHMAVMPYCDGRYFCAINAKAGSLAVWDRRHLALPLVLGGLFAASGYHPRNLRPCVAFSASVRGEMATLHQDSAGSVVRRWRFGLTDGETDALFLAQVRARRLEEGRAVAFDTFCDNGAGKYVVLTASGRLRVESEGTVGGGARFNSSNYVATTDGKSILIESPVQSPSPSASQSAAPVQPVPPASANGLPGAASGAAGAQSVESRSATQVLDLPPVDILTKTPAEVLLEDIALVMRARVLSGYSLGDLEVNLQLFLALHGQAYLNSNYEGLRICWKWLHHQQRNLRTLLARHALNISFEGVYNLWDGVREIIEDEKSRCAAGAERAGFTDEAGNRQFVRMLEQILAAVREPGKRYTEIFVPNLRKQVQRLYCLFLCGWYITTDAFDAKIEKLCLLGMYEKAAGLCVFNGDVVRAISILDSAHNSTLKIIAAAMAGFLNHDENGEARPQWKSHCEQLAEELDLPYLRAIFAYLVDRKWRDVLQMGSLALKEKLLIAFRYLPDNRLTEYLQSTTTAVIRNGDPDGIMLTGLTRKGMGLLQRYNDVYGDVQTVALISSFVVPKFFDDMRAQRWIATYRELLNLWGFYSQRAQFDIKRRLLSKNDFYVPKHGKHATDGFVSRPYLLAKSERQLYLKCITCGADILDTLTKKAPAKHHPPMVDDDEKAGTVTCANCRLPLPKCAICLYSLGSPIRYVTGEKSALEVFNDWGCFCLSCNHAMHLLHASEWFDIHEVCPVPDCECVCRKR